MTSTDKLIKMIPEMTPVEFAGLARVLDVKLLQTNPEYDESKDISVENSPSICRDFTDVFEDVLKNFGECNRARKREILQIVKASNKFKGNSVEDIKNAVNTTNS